MSEKKFDPMSIELVFPPGMLPSEIKGMQHVIGLEIDRREEAYPASPILTVFNWQNEKCFEISAEGHVWAKEPADATAAAVVKKIELETLILAREPARAKIRAEAFKEIEDLVRKEEHGQRQDSAPIAWKIRAYAKEHP